MAGLKRTSAGASTADTVKKIPAILGCIVLLFSLIFPFYYGAFSTLAGGGETSFWSCRAESQSYFLMHSNLENFWFISYWFSSNWQSPLKVVITGIFIIQILTLAFGLASVAFNRRLFSITPVVLCLILLALMLFTGFTIAQQGWGTQVQKSSFGGGAEEFRLGFYLILPSLTMFLLALTPNKWLTRETITHQRFE